MVLTLLGPDLTKLRNEQKPRRFSPGTALRVGRSTLEAIQELHEKCGYISRDIVSLFFCLMRLANSFRNREISPLA